jgi:NhaA family Na+:H+ antiporter
MHEPETPASESFLHSETVGALALLAATVVALAWANWSGGASYADVWNRHARHWVNDGAMSLFFFVIGLEIRRELGHGELRDRRAALLPVLAALGGMGVPALVFLVVAGGGGAGHAWGIPMATDVAFAVGVLALVGRRAPAGLRVFLLTLAVADDVGAVVVITVVYAGGLLHPTLLAVAIALVLPLAPPALERLERVLHPWSSLLVVPLFALANAGVSLDGDALRTAASSRLTWAVVLGLAAGKPLGITGAVWLARRTGRARPPDGVDSGHLAGGAVLAGIGFTVSLLIAGLALPDARLAEAKVGILGGSLLSAGLGAAVVVAQARRSR